MATIAQTPSTTASPQKPDDTLVLVAGIVGGAVFLFMICIFIGLFLIRRKRRRAKMVLLRGRNSKKTPEVPLQYAKRTITTTVEAIEPSLSKDIVWAQPPRIDIATRGPASTSTRPMGIHERYASPYTATALERAYEALERNITSPTPSVFSGRTDGAGSRIASPQPSSDLEHGRFFRSGDQSPPATASRPLTARSIESVQPDRPGPSAYQRVAAMRRPSEIRRDELLAALDPTVVVAVARWPGASSRLSDGSIIGIAGNQYRPP